MSVYRNQAGAWVVSAIVGGYYASMAFYGYTKREAVSRFRAAVREGRV